MRTLTANAHLNANGERRKPRIFGLFRAFRCRGHARARVDTPTKGANAPPAAFAAADCAINCKRETAFCRADDYAEFFPLSPRFAIFAPHGNTFIANAAAIAENGVICANSFSRMTARAAKPPAAADGIADMRKICRAARRAGARIRMTDISAAGRKTPYSATRRAGFSPRACERP